MFSEYYYYFSCGEVIEAKHTTSISSAIPLFEGDQKQLDEKPNLAVKLLQDDADLNVVILDRTLAGEIL